MKKYNWGKNYQKAEHKSKDSSSSNTNTMNMYHYNCNCRLNACLRVCCMYILHRPPYNLSAAAVAAILSHMCAIYKQHLAACTKSNFTRQNRVSLVAVQPISDRHSLGKFPLSLSESLLRRFCSFFLFQCDVFSGRCQKFGFFALVEFSNNIHCCAFYVYI